MRSACLAATRSDGNAGAMYGAIDGDPLGWAPTAVADTRSGATMRAMWKRMRVLLLRETHDFVLKRNPALYGDGRRPRALDGRRRTCVDSTPADDVERRH